MKTSVIAIGDNLRLTDTTMGHGASWWEPCYIWSQQSFLLLHSSRWTGIWPTCQLLAASSACTLFALDLSLACLLPPSWMLCSCLTSSVSSESRKPDNPPTYWRLPNPDRCFSSLRYLPGFANPEDLSPSFTQASALASSLKSPAPVRLCFLARMEEIIWTCTLFLPR